MKVFHKDWRKSTREHIMHYTKLSVAGCAALMFGLIACSGEDGKDGVNGVNGLNGADGASCEVKSLKDESGYKVLCGGDSVINPLPESRFRVLKLFE